MSLKPNNRVSDENTEQRISHGRRAEDVTFARLENDINKLAESSLHLVKAVTELSATVKAHDKDISNLQEDRKFTWQPLAIAVTVLLSLGGITFNFYDRDQEQLRQQQLRMEENLERTISSLRDRLLVQDQTIKADVRRENDQAHLQLSTTLTQVADVFAKVMDRVTHRIDTIDDHVRRLERSKQDE